MNRGKLLFAGILAWSLCAPASAGPAPSLVRSACEKGFKVLNKLNGAQKTALLFFEGEGRSNGPIYRPKELARFIYNFSFHELLPIPEWKNNRAPIFAKLWKDVHYQPTQEELDLLMKYNALKDFDEKREFMLKHPKWTKFRKRFSKAFHAALYLNYVMAADYFAQELSADSMTLDRYMNDPKEKIGENEANLIIETVPFPHASLQIGGRVYSYGVDHFTAKSVEEYFRSGTLEELRKGGLNHFGDGRGFADRAYSALFQNLEKLPRSVHVVTLKLTPEEKAKLQRALEMETGKWYDNMHFVNDCSTMLFRQIQKNTSIRVPEFVDPYPTLTAETLAFEKTAGNSKIGKIRLLKMDDDQNKALHAARNATLALAEGNFSLYFAAFKVPRRIWNDLFKTESQLAYYEPETQKRIAEWHDQVKAELEADPDIVALKSKVAGSDPLKARAKVDLILEGYYGKANRYLDPSSGATFDRIVEAQFQIQVLDEIKAEMLAELGV